MLCVTFDSTLRWQEHINSLCNKLKNCFSLKFLKNHLSSDVLRSVYYANIHAHIRYGILNWGLSSFASRVFLIQKYAVRILAGLSPRELCRASFKSLKILTLSGIYILEACVYVFKNKNSFESYRSSHDYNTRHKLAYSKQTSMNFLPKKCIL